jgi:hypothetical protein
MIYNNHSFATGQGGKPKFNISSARLNTSQKLTPIAVSHNASNIQPNPGKSPQKSLNQLGISEEKSPPTIGTSSVPHLNKQNYYSQNVNSNVMTNNRLGSIGGMLTPIRDNLYDQGNLVKTLIPKVNPFT